MDKRFKLTKDANPNYLATICKIENVYPIEGADRLVKTVINGYDIVIGKDYAPGTIVVYFPVESAICHKFLSANNLYEMSEFERNSNADEVKAILTQVDTLKESDIEKGKELSAQAKALCGFFNKHGRVRILKLRGQYSMGFVASVDAMIKYDSSLADVDWDSMVGCQFNYIGDDEFVKKYIPAVREQQHTGTGSQSQWKKRMKKLKRFDRLIPGQFVFHYDTKMLGEHISEFNPNDNVVISCKLHGTSGIFSNILTKRQLNRWERIKKFFGFYVKEEEYGNVYSSRSVIKNQYINPRAQSFYGTDIWGCVDKVIAPYLEKGMTVYGEIVGYIEGTSKYIQKDHDYGCKPGEWKFMPYRVTMTEPDGTKTEWDLEKVDAWTRELVKNHEELKDKIMFLTILYTGRFGDLYPDIAEDEQWQANVLERMKNDTEHFLMEKYEPLCKNKVPREGIVIRKNGDQYARAWKLKTKAHYARECKSHDQGEADIEETA